MITHDVPFIMSHLKTEFGKITMDELEVEVQAIKNYAFDPAGSIDILLNSVFSHAEFCEIAGAKISDEQIINLAYLLINKF